MWPRTDSRAANLFPEAISRAPARYIVFIGSSLPILQGGRGMKRAAARRCQEPAAVLN